VGADPHDLGRFVLAQSSHYERALAELRRGRKATHWMWFIFPQIAGLGGSDMARRYAVRGLAEARAYLAHPVLGSRLLACAEAVLAIEGRSARAILGSPDDLKLRSCVTLFAQVAPAGSAFPRVLDKYYEGRPDPLTLSRLDHHPEEHAAGGMAPV